MLNLYMISRGCCIKSWTRIPVGLLNTKFYLNLSGEVPKLQVLVKSVKAGGVSRDLQSPDTSCWPPLTARHRMRLFTGQQSHKKTQQLYSEAKKVQTDIVYCGNPQN